MLTREDADGMDKARRALKRRLYKRVAEEEFKKGLIPMSIRQCSLIDSIAMVNKLEEQDKKAVINKYHGVEININTDQIITDKTQIKMTRKVWVKDAYKIQRTDTGYSLIVLYEYKMKDGSVGKRTMSMMRKELVSSLKINKITVDDITCRILNEQEYTALTAVEVD